MATLRMFSSAGPCLPMGEIVRETPKFYVVRDRHGAQVRVSKQNDSAHTEACRSCRDHSDTVYPNGYMD